MIVECSHCNTKFNLPDDKVKPEGVKIRCTRCKNVFTVTPPNQARPQEDSLSAGLDDDLSAFSEGGSDLSAEGTEKSDLGGDLDQDLGTDDFGLDTGDSDFNLDADLDQGSARKTGGSADDSLEFDLGKGTGGVPGGGDSLEFDLGEKKGPDAGVGASSDKGLEGNLGDLDISFDEASTAGGAKSVLDEGGDFDLSALEDEKPQASSRPPASAAGPQPGKAKTIGDDFPMGNDDFLGNKGGDIGFGDSVGIGMDDSGIGDIEEPKLIKKPKKKASRTSPMMVAVLIIFLLAAVGYYGYTTYFAKGFDPVKLLSLFSGKEDPLAGFENVETKMQYYYVENKEIGKIFVVEGAILNHSEVPKGRIKVRVTFYDKAGKEIGRSESYAGNILDLGQLEALPRTEITKLLSVEAGKKFNNALIKPAESIPYMLVVFSVPKNTDGYNVTVVDAQVVGK